MIAARRGEIESFTPEPKVSTSDHYYLRLCRYDLSRCLQHLYRTASLGSLDASAVSAIVLTSQSFQADGVSCIKRRAVDNQMFVMMCSPARATTGEGYKAYGFSGVSDPMQVSIRSPIY